MNFALLEEIFLNAVGKNKMGHVHGNYSEKICYPVCMLLLCIENKNIPFFVISLLLL